MKKLLFAFIATIMLTGVGFGQKQQPTQEQVEMALVERMAEFIKNLGTFYKNGQTYDQFKAELYKSKKAPTTLPKEGEDLLKKAYSYLVKGGATKEQVRKDGVKEMVNALKFIDKSGNDYSLFGVSNEAALSDINVAGKYPCKWWQIGCHLKEIFDISIKDILEIILG